MANEIRIKRRWTGLAGSPASLKSGELAFNGVDNILYLGYGDDGSGGSTSISAIAGVGAFVGLTGAQNINGVKTFASSPIVPTATGGDNSTKAASTAFVQAAIAAVAGSVADGDKGDITVSSGQWFIENGAVTLAKMANIGTMTLLGNNTGAGAPPIALSVADIKTMLAYTKGDVGLNNVENTALSTWAGSTNITSVGTIATGVWAGTAIAVNKGGTGLSSYTPNSLLYASGATAIGQVAPANNAVLVSNGSGVPSFATTLPADLTAAGLRMSGAATVSAGGTTQGTATALNNDLNVVTTVGANSGVALPLAALGKSVIVINKGANPLNVYPGTSTAIDGLAANIPVVVPVNGWVCFTGSSSSQWYSTLNATLAAAALTGTLAAAQLPGLTGDVTAAAGSNATTISNGAVTLAKQANLAANSIIGNNTGSAATPIALTGAQVKTLLALVAADVGLGNVNNTSDANKPVSTAQQAALDLKANLSLVGAANGIASLGSDGKVPSAQLPGFVDDVIEAANFAALPGTGETGKLYVTLDDNKTYRWGGSSYVLITSSPGSTDSVTEGSINLYFTDTRARTAVIVQTITNGDTTHAPSADVVFDQLALKLTAASNLSDLANAGTARTNLGLGSMATQAANSVAITGGTIDGVVIDGGTF